MDNLTREKIREWQIRRLEIKDQIQIHPEKSLELSRVLDLMDEEHAAIISGSATTQNTGRPTIDTTASVESPRHAHNRLNLRLHVAAHSPEDLSKLLEIAVYDLQKQIEVNGAEGAGVKYPGGMSGTLGEYHFELCVSGEESHD